VAMQTLDEREVDVQDQPNRASSGSLVFVAWQRRSLVILGILVGLVGGALFYLQRTPVYQSSAQVLVMKNTPGMTALPGVEGRVAVVEDFLSTHSTILRSEEIQRRAAAFLKDDPPPGLAADTDFATLIATGLNVIRDKEAATGNSSNILNLTFRCSAPEACPLVMKAVIRAYKEFIDDTQKKVKGKTLRMVEEYVLAVEKVRSSKQQEHDNRLRPERAKEQLTIYQANITTYEAKRANLRLKVKEIQSRREALAHFQKQGLSRAALLGLIEGASPNGPRHSGPTEGKTLEETIRQLQLQEEDLAERVGKDHPERIAVAKRLKVARELFAKQAGEGAGGRDLDAFDLALAVLDQETSEAEKQLTELGKMIEDETAKARPLEIVVAKDAADEAELARLTKTTEDLGGIIRTLNASDLMGGFSVDEITRPKEGIKVAPNLPQSLLLAGVIGLVFGLSLAYLAEITDKSFRSPEDIRRRLGLPVVGHIPPITARAGAAATAALDPMVCAYYRPKALESEAYRGVRTSLYFSTQGRAHKVIQVTSPNAADGKSTLSANLAVSVAQSGKRVILVDADFRKPRVHQIFGLEAVDAGLAQVIAGSVDLESVLVPCPSVPGLWLLPCGKRPANPAELLTSPRFVEVLQELRERFDIVLLDTPPILAVSDPSVVAPRVDGVILTVRVTKNGRPAAVRAKEVLTSLGANVLGVVVNGFAGAGSPYGYYSYYHAPYHYEESHGYVNQDDDDPSAPPRKSR
jgi:polysaccharide biosynthesis transport protein